jgi:hypothetical protein
VVAFEKYGPISTKTYEPCGCVLFNQTPLLHEGLNNDNNKIISISTSNHMNCDKKTKLFSIHASYKRIFKAKIDYQ